MNSSWPGVIEHYRAFLPVSNTTPVVTLLEGGTPLVPAPRLAQRIGAKIELWLKFEGLNPTCSFKDRGMTVAVSKAVESGKKVIICASTGNTSASAAAYAARAGLRCIVLIPHGKIALGKLSQALMYGAKTVAIEGNFDTALELVKRIGEMGIAEIVNSINPYRIEGQKTAAFEICDVLGRAPDYHFLPVGNAGNITAYWRGFCEYYERGLIASRPKMCGLQAAGAAPIVEGRPIPNPETVATAIRIGNPASWQGAVRAVKESGGWIDKVTDEEIIEAYRLLARTEGILAEPASAAPIAGLIKSVRTNRIPERAVVSITLTGHGLKDPDIALKGSGCEPIVCPAELERLLELIEE